MREVKISLGTIEKVKDFVSIMTRLSTEIDLISGRYVVDAKSIMGIFSLDLSKPITLRINAEGEAAEEVIKVIKEYLVG